MRAVKELAGDRRWQRRVHPPRTCPACQAVPGSPCRTASGHWREDHPERADPAAEASDGPLSRL